VRPLRALTRLLEELGVIAFADIGNVVSWDETEPAHEISPHEPGLVSGEKPRAFAEGATKFIRPKATIMPSASMDAVVRRAISKVVMTDNGGLRIEMHDKIAALNKLARALGMYTEKRDFKPNTHPVTAVTIYEGRPAPWPAPDEPALASRQVTRSAVPTHPRSTGRIRSMLAEP
jgi:hypothetical protein